MSFARLEILSGAIQTFLTWHITSVYLVDPAFLPSAYFLSVPKDFPFSRCSVLLPLHVLAHALALAWNAFSHPHPPGKALFVL